MSDLQRQLRELLDETNARVARDPLNAYEVREEALLRAHELVERRSTGPELYRVSDQPLPHPGEAGFRRAGLRP